MTGEEIEIGVNNRFVLDALKNSECDMVRIEMSTPVSPIDYTEWRRDLWNDMTIEKVYAEAVKHEKNKKIQP
jgi:DNA polymerase III sliding clamp (beta) subunit (PCNA family)